MGIRNVIVVEYGGFFFMNSLPLMGIRNHLRQFLKISPKHGSLPLMGIRNANSKPHIQPHTGASLPLMGIRNGEVIFFPDGPGDLITPHGD